MKEFEDYINIGIVKKQTPNKDRAISLVQEAEDKKAFLELTRDKLSAKEMNPNFIVDYSYDIIMELIRAKLYLDGFNSKNSHEAEVSYLKKLGFSEFDIKFMDELRYYRNGIKYYGTKLEKEYADKVFKFMNAIYPQLKKLILQN